jgi:hypothetical protein
MNTFLALLAGGGLVAAGSVASGLLANWLGSRRDKRGYTHEQEMAREARIQERLDQAYIAPGEYLSRFEDWARSDAQAPGAPRAVSGRAVLGRYGPQAMLAVLVLAGLPGLSYSLAVGAAIAFLILAVGISYRQTIRA